MQLQIVKTYRIKSIVYPKIVCKGLAIFTGAQSKLKTTYGGNKNDGK